MTKTLDLGCGPEPKNPLNCAEVWGIDIQTYNNPRIHIADLATEPIPYPDNCFDVISAYDFIEHVPRVIYLPQRRFAFVELMNEIYRTLKPGGIFYSHTPAYPKPEVFRDPTHVNIITDQTFPLYFDNHHKLAQIYGFVGSFNIESQNWHTNNINLVTIMRKQ